MPSTEGAGGRVALALSGGTDSAAAAVLLRREGHQVLALTMRLERAGGKEDDPTVEGAAEVAGELGIEHQVVDLSIEFTRRVVEPFVRQYLGGRTPNPCVLCNREMKFGLLLAAARERGCDLLATGHYVRVTGAAGERRILRAADLAKDQSYVLWTLGQEQLGRALFPLGGLTRKQSEELAVEAGLAEKVAPESQDICFMRGDSYHRLVERLAEQQARPGPVVDRAGNVLGSHRGLPYYTVGQRRGLGIGGERALYVLEIAPAQNALVVGGIEERYCESFAVEGLVMPGARPGESVRCGVMTRYRGPLLRCRLSIGEGGAARVDYDEKGPPAAAGQSAVFYRREALLGGGVISAGG